MTTPGHTTDYVGPITNTNRWVNFQYRPDDIFICTPPKCGTTWTHAIVAMLVFGKVDHGQKPGVISPWVDADFAPIDEYLQMVEGQDHRRFLKTHSPFDGIPYYEECAYLAVMRDPRDMYCSMLHHRDNMNDAEMAHMVMPSGDDAFEKWLDGTLNPDKFDVQSLHGAMHFFKTYWDYRDATNVHLMHYYDMKIDLKGHIANLADFLDIELSDQFLDDMTAAATFESMQAKGDQFAPMAGNDFWKSENGFFARGTNAQYKEVLSGDQLIAFDHRIRELIDAEQYDWLMRS